jgi:hypothetical protein
MTSPRGTLVALIALAATALARTAPAALAAGSGAGATRAATRHAIAYVKRYAVILRPSDRDVQCSAAGRSHWKCFVYANPQRPVSGRRRRVGAAARMPRPTTTPKTSSVTLGLRYSRAIPSPRTGSESAA